MLKRNRLSYFVQLIQLWATSRDRLHLAVLIAYLFFLRRVGRFPQLNSPTRVDLRIDGRPTPFYIWHQLDLNLMYIAFVEKELAVLPEVSDCKVIVDLGSNIGVTVAYFHAKYPNAKIFAVEPDPHCVEQLRMTLSAMEQDKVVLLPKAAHREDGKKVTFYSSAEYHWASSLFDRTETHNVPNTPVTVESITLDEVVKKYGIKNIDILKFDIEGAEYDVFAHFTHMSKIRYAVGELHPKLFKKTTEEFLSLWQNFEVLSKDGLVVLKNKNLEN